MKDRAKYLKLIKSFHTEGEVEEVSWVIDRGCMINKALGFFSKGEKLRKREPKRLPNPAVIPEQAGSAITSRDSNHSFELVE